MRRGVHQVRIDLSTPVFIGGGVHSYSESFFFTDGTNLLPRCGGVGKDSVCHAVWGRFSGHEGVGLTAYRRMVRFRRRLWMSRKVLGLILSISAGAGRWLCSGGGVGRSNGSPRHRHRGFGATAGCVVRRGRA